MSWEVYTESERRANRSHLCKWCNTAIVKGEVYSHWKGKYQGDWQDTKMHFACEAAMRRDADQRGDFEVEICEERHLKGMTCEEMNDDPLCHQPRLLDDEPKCYLCGFNEQAHDPTRLYS